MRNRSHGDLQVAAVVVIVVVVVVAVVVVVVVLEIAPQCDLGCLLLASVCAHIAHPLFRSLHNLSLGRLARLIGCLRVLATVRYSGICEDSASTFCLDCSDVV